MKPEDLNPEEELEVRITALLLGELTAEEAAEVRAELARNPDLMRLHDRLKAVLGLVKDAVPTTELPADAIPEPLALANERREELLAVFQGGQPKVKEAKIIKVSFWSRYRRDLLKLAAMVMGLLGISWLMLGKRETQTAYLETTTQVDVLESGRSVIHLFGGMDMERAGARPASPSASATSLSEDAAIEAQAQVVAQMVAGTNPYIYDLADSRVQNETVAFAASAMPANKPQSLTVLPDMQRSISEASTLNFSAANIRDDNRAQVQLSSRAPSSAERPVNAGRSPKGVTTLSGRSAASDFIPQAQSVAGADVGVQTEGLQQERFEVSPRGGAGEGNYTYRVIPSGSPQMDTIHNYNKSLSQTVEMGDGVAQQSAARNLRIILPETEVAQVKGLSDNYFGGNGQNQGMPAATRFGKEAQVAQSAAGQAGGTTGLNYWAYSGQNGVVDFTTPQSTPSEISKDIGGQMPSKGMSLFGDVEFKVMTGRGLVEKSTDVLATGDRLSRMDAPARPATPSAADKVDDWRRARQEYVPNVSQEQPKPATQPNGATVYSAGAVGFVDINQNSAFEAGNPASGQKLSSIQSKSEPDARDGAAMASGRMRGLGGEKSASDPAGQPSDSSGDVAVLVTGANGISRSIVTTYGTTPMPTGQNQSGKSSLQDLSYSHFSEGGSSLSPAGGGGVRVGQRIDSNRPDVVAPGSMVISERAGMSNYYVGDPAWKGVLQDSYPGSVPDEWPAHSRTNKFIGRYAYTLPQGQTTDLSAGKDQAATATVLAGSGKPPVAVMPPPSPTVGFLTGGLRQNIGVGGQLGALAANGPATDFGIEAKAKQSGKPVDSDADFQADNRAKKLAQKTDEKSKQAFLDPMPKADGFNLDVIDLTIAHPLPEPAMTVGQPAPVLSFDLKPEVEEVGKGQALPRLPENERTHRNYDDRTPNVAQKLRKSGEAMLGERLERESAAEVSSKELTDQRAGAKSEVDSLTANHLGLARQYFQNRDYAAADKAAAELLKIDPENKAAKEFRKYNADVEAKTRQFVDGHNDATTGLKTRVFKVDPKTFGGSLMSFTGIPTSPEFVVGQSGGGDLGDGSKVAPLAVPRVVMPQGGGMGGGAGITGVTPGVQSEELQKRTRQFFAAAGVDLNSNANGGATPQIFYNDRTGTLMVRASDQDLETIQSAIDVLSINAPQVQVEARFAETKEPMLPKAPAVQELAKLTEEKKEGESLRQLTRESVEAKKAVQDQEKLAKAKKPEPTPPGIPQPEVSTAQNAFSTFSLNVSDVSFKLAAASLEKGLMPEVGSVRTEEFINAFNYHDPEPTGNARIAFAWERARYPFAQDRDLVRFSVQTAAVGREPGKPLNIVLLLDNSGSMERADRLRIRQECLRVLASQLQPQDKVSVVSFARTARLWVDGLTGAQIKELPARVGNLTPEGGTNLEEAMNLAYQTAQNHYSPQGVNRVVLLTDGAANLGDVQPESLKKKVVEYRKQGVALDCFGIGWEGYNDDLLEALSRNGDGRYGFVNSPEAATTEFASQLAGALKVAASDVKVQVEWNPKRVTVFRQLGYAKHQLKKEEFRDNKVDAAEIGAAEAGNALYTVQVNPAGEGPLGVVRVRYRLPNTNDYREQEWPLAYDGPAKEMELASVPLRLAGTASAFSEWLVSSPFAGEVTPERLIVQMAGVPEAYPADPRPKQLEWMIRQAKSLSGK